MNQRNLTTRLAICLFLVFHLSCTQHPGPVLISGDLQVGNTTEKKTLAFHAADTFKLELADGALVYGNVDQLSVDVLVRIINPLGKTVGEFDGPGRGPEYFDFETDTAGVYKIVVSPFKENTGDYTISLGGAEQISQDVDKRITQVVTASLGSLDGPGAAVAVERDGEVIYSKGFGHADLEHDVHITPSTVFHIASVSKQFTAFAIAMLVDQ